MYLLDTNIVSEPRRTRPHGAVLAWIGHVEASALHISAVTLGEIQAGIERLRTQDAAKAAEIDAWADLLAASYNVLPLDAATFRRWARLMHGQPDSLYEDAMIAATALERGLIVATRNVRDFEPFDVPVLNPFETPRP